MNNYKFQIISTLMWLVLVNLTKEVLSPCRLICFKVNLNITIGKYEHRKVYYARKFIGKYSGLYLS